MMRDSKTKGKKTRRPKMKLGLPDPHQAKSAELNSLRSPESQRGYRHSIGEFVAWHRSEPRLFQQNLSRVIEFISKAVSWRHPYHWAPFVLMGKFRS